MNCHNLDQLLSHFDDKIQAVYQLIPFTQLYDKTIVNKDWKRNPQMRADPNDGYFGSDDYNKRLLDKRPDLREISQMMVEMKAMTTEMKVLVKQQKQQMVYQNNECEKQLEQMERHCHHINKNIPIFLQKENQINDKTDQKVDTKTGLTKSQGIGVKNGVSKVNPKTNQKAITKPNANPNVRPTQESRVGVKSVKKKVISKEIPTIAFITTEEFSSIPNYMLGRLTYEVINRAVADYNRTIAAKYKTLFNYSTKYSDEEMRKYINFKEQENNETEGQFFCTIDDLKALSDLKVDATIRKALTCLRHCRRIREIRGNPPKLIRYAIIKSELNF